ncbi:MAG: 50S ribosomal protein L31e [Candidatus Anstonellaceae archaeon]
MANLERIYTIPLGKIYELIRNKRGKRAITFIRDFALRHMKANAVRISEGVNSAILRDGIQKPPRRIKVRIVKGEDSIARVWLIGEEEKVKEAADKKKAADEAKKKAEEKKAAAPATKTAPSAQPTAQASKPATAQATASAPAAQPASKPAAATAPSVAKK